MDRLPLVTPDALAQLRAQVALDQEAGLAAVQAAGDPTIYTLSKAGDMETLLSSVPLGMTAEVNTSTDVDATIVTDGQRNISGGGMHVILKGTPALGKNPVMLIQPPADGNVYDTARVSQLFVWADAAGGDALKIDVTGTRKFARVLFDQVFLRAPSPDGYALNLENEMAAPDSQDGFFCPTFVGGVLDGGVRLRGMGDSPTFVGVTITGEAAFEMWQQTYVQSNTEASQALITGCNITCGKGTIVHTGMRFRLHSNNMELKAGANAGAYSGAAVQLLGSADTRYHEQYGVTYDEYIVGSTIRDNYIGCEVARPAIFLDYADQTEISGNTLDIGAANTYAIVIGPNAKNTIVGQNVIHCAAGYEIDDKGKGTMGVYKPMTGLGAGVTLHSQQPGQFIKRPDGVSGQVTLSGRLKGGGTAEGSLLFVLPEGHRCISGRYPLVPLLIRYTVSGVSGLQVRQSWAVVNPTGEVTLGETLPSGAAVVDVLFSGSFESPLI